MQEFPKYVVPHGAHIVRQNDHVSTPNFPVFHVNRADNVVTVLVRNEDEEAFALADPTPKPEEEPKKRWSK